MGRSPCCEKAHTNKGAWTREEDQRLIDYIRVHGEGCWRSLPKAAGLLRCGKSCRLRWINYLRPDLKRGNFTEEEDDLIIKLHSLLGNKWSLIAARLPGRTDNEIKNYWNTHIKRKLISRGIDPQTHRPLNETAAATTAAVAAAATATQLDFKKSSFPVAEINLVKQSQDNFNCINFGTGLKKPKKETIEDLNYASSDTTTEEGSPLQRDSYGGELNLELSIGLVPYHSKSTRGNSAESKLELVPLQLVGAVQPAMAAQAAAVCLCCQLGYQNGELCSQCQFKRYCSNLNS
ncbi:hypothetical protein L6164_017249 [Bauhinia variegata]|uniref:Uncharacterized protein n=1 Tax=Bauhinia variegata TaxID=167791 RepID=A0ACB9N9A0_BAUVA|nr:hypothetical protein L6164_017249 [Bauhinia variegata]